MTKKKAIKKTAKKKAQPKKKKRRVYARARSRVLVPQEAWTVKRDKIDVAFASILDWIIVSDLHAGCRSAVCPPEGFPLDGGGRYMPSPLQLKIWAYWREFWDVFVPGVTAGRKYGIILNGDATQGKPHGSISQISDNLEDQARFAEQLLEPQIDKCHGFYMLRGTEAHGGKSGAEEEKLAKRLGARPNEYGQYARFDLWKWIGDCLLHTMHHVGTTGSNAYEATAVHKELTEEFIEAARWRHEPPMIIARSHRHRSITTAIPIETDSKNVLGTCEAKAVVTPGWQAKTPFAWKIAGARVSSPQFGGLLIRRGAEVAYTRPYVRSIGRSRAE